MHYSSALVATIALLSSVAVAEVEHPKFYIPRQIKRQATSNEPVRRSVQRVHHAHPKRQFDPLGIFGPGGADPTGDKTTADAGPPVSASPKDSDTGVVTVVVQSTVFAGDATPTKTSDPAPTTSDSGFLGGIGSGLGSIIGGGGDGGSKDTSTTSSSTSSDADDTKTTQTDDGSSTTTSAPAATTTSADDGSGLGNAVSSILNPSTTPSDQVTTTSDPASTTTTPADPAGGGEGDTNTQTSSSTTSSDPGNAVSSVVGGLTSTTPTAAPTTTSVTTPADPQTTSTTTPPVDPPQTTPSASVTDIQPVGNATVTPPLDSQTVSGTSTVLPVPTITPSVTPPGVEPANGTVSATGSSTIPPAVITSGISPPADVSATGSSSVSTVGPALNATTPVVVGGATLTSATASGTATGTADVIPASTASATATPSVTPVTPGPQTLQPIGTNSATSLVVPSQIVMASSTSGALASTTASGIPSTLPKVIEAPDGAPKAPDNHTLIQLAYDFPLHYTFVVENWASQVQLFEFVPAGLAYGLGISPDKVKMQQLSPFDTTKQLNYITTISLAYIPDNLVDALRVAIHTPLSDLYQNPEPSVNTLMNLVNPAIDIIPGSVLGPNGAPIPGMTSGGGSGSSSPTDGDKGGDDGVFSTSDQSQGGAKKAGTAAGVAIGAATAAAAYGAAMFFIARRYKRKRSLHRRSSSLTNSPEMYQHASPALMGGALGGRDTPSTDRHSQGSGRTGGSARTQQISAPLAAENSLGWN